MGLKVILGLLAKGPLVHVENFHPGKSKMVKNILGLLGYFFGGRK